MTYSAAQFPPALLQRGTGKIKNLEIRLSCLALERCTEFERFPPASYGFEACSPTNCSHSLREWDFCAQAP
jgi:hypothetical protein